MVIMWTVRTPGTLESAKRLADNIIFECDDKKADNIALEKAKSFLS